LKGDEVVNETSGVKIKENAFTFRLLQSEGAEVVYSCKGLPLEIGRASCRERV